MIGDSIFIVGVASLVWFTASWVMRRFPAQPPEVLPVEPGGADEAAARAING
jgi:hypothetical protein